MAPRRSEHLAYSARRDVAAPAMVALAGAQTQGLRCRSELLMCWLHFARLCGALLVARKHVRQRQRSQVLLKHQGAAQIAAHLLH